MKVRDRLTGKIVEAPDALIPGHYAAAGPLMINGHSRLGAGDLLLDDGSGTWRWDEGHRVFAHHAQQGQDGADVELSGDAIRTIAARARQSSKTSPMIPLEIVSEGNLLPVEEELASVLEKGHLQSISERPRLDVRYEEMVVPVSRARRLAKGALTHIASRSECWQRRTLDGIQPRKVLARFSEDEYALYENRLYARLLDILESHLVGRIDKVRGLTRRLEDALDFQGSDRVHYRLRDRVCRLWGETFSDDGSDSLQAARNTIEILNGQLRAVRGLKQRGLYTIVPRSAQVGGQVHRTNILNHDPHYRHVPPLWERFRERRSHGSAPPEQVLAAACRSHRDYSDFVGLVIRRALDRHAPEDAHDGFRFQWAGGQASARRHGGDWILEAEGATPLRMVPLFWFGDLDGRREIGEDTLVCTPVAPDDAPSWRLPVSPMDLYVVERMGRILDRWLIAEPAKHYGRSLERIPGLVSTAFVGWPEIVAVESETGRAGPPGARFAAPLPKERSDRLKRALESHANPELRAAFLSAMRGLEILSTCPACLKKGRFQPRGSAEMLCECLFCNIRWGVKTADGKRLFFRQPGGDTQGADPFVWAGRDWDEMALK